MRRRNLKLLGRLNEASFRNLVPALLLGCGAVFDFLAD
jgi:hypothetical protein